MKEMKWKEERRIRRIRLESNLEKKKREEDTTQKVRGKTEGEIGKVSAEKGDTLVIPRGFSGQWRVVWSLPGTGVLLTPASWVNKIQEYNTIPPRQLELADWAVWGRTGAHSAPFAFGCIGILPLGIIYVHLYAFMEYSDSDVHTYVRVYKIGYYTPYPNA